MTIKSVILILFLIKNIYSFSFALNTQESVYALVWLLLCGETRRWGDGGMGRWGDGEMGGRGDAGTRGRGDAGIGRWGDEEMGR